MAARWPSKGRSTSVERCVVFLAVALAVRHAESTGRMLALLGAKRVSADTFKLKLVLLNTGVRLGSREQAVVEFRQAKPTRGEKPWRKAVALDCAKWPASHVAVVDLGQRRFAAASLPIDVRGGLVGRGKLARLGSIARGKDGRVAFHRRFPWPCADESARRIALTAAAKRLGPRRFQIKLGCFNCGERFDRDLSAFLHFEFEPKGENLDPAIALNLLPASQNVDSSIWAADTVTVVTFPPVTVPPAAPKYVYIRAGLYDRLGDGKRCNIAGCDDGTGRVLVGRFVNGPERVEFERLLPAFLAEPKD